jgi:hypothetical protein
LLWIHLQTSHNSKVTLPPPKMMDCRNLLPLSDRKAMPGRAAAFGREENSYSPSLFSLPWGAFNLGPAIHYYYYYYFISIMKIVYYFIFIKQFVQCDIYIIVSSNFFSLNLEKIFNPIFRIIQ